MAINFPTSPSTNDTHTHNDVTYKWDGTSWLAQGSTSTYSLPTASSTVLGGIKVGNRLTITSGVLDADVQGGVTSDSAENTVAGTLAGGSFTVGNASNNTLYGWDAGGDITTGDDNTCVGYGAGDKITDGSKNTAIGSDSLDACSSGYNNVAVGWEAGRSITSGNNNCCLGSYSGVTLGNSVGAIAIGQSSVSNSGVQHSIGIGNNALRNGGDYCIAMGYEAAWSQRDGDYNVYIGYKSAGLYQGTSPWGEGDNQVGIGRESLGNILGGTTNTAVGAYAGDSLTSGSNNICLGYEADASSATTSNEITIGNSSITKFRVPGINFTVKDSTATEDYVLTLDANGEAGWEAATGGTSTTYDLTAANGSVATEEKILLTGSDSSEDAVTLAVSGNLTIARSNNTITFGGGTYSAGTGLSLSGTTFNVTSTYMSSRTTAAATTASLADQASGNIDITAAKAYALLKIQTSNAAWVTLYTDATSRTNDANRNITTDPLPGSGVVAEVLLSDGGVQKITPGLIGYNDDATPTTTVYAKVQNRSGSAAAITVTLHYLALEG